MIHKLNLLFILMLILTLALTACGGGNGDEDKPADKPSGTSGDATKGKDLYPSACSACHGPNGEGVEGLGKPWTGSTFIQSLSDDEMLAFVKKGRPIGDPANTTGVDMPPKGGNPALNDEDLLNIIAFMRTLQ